MENVKITQYVTTIVEAGPDKGKKILHEEAELKVGQYNEFYLPSLIGMGRSSEMWIIIETDGVETKIHLKR